MFLLFGTLAGLVACATLAVWWFHYLLLEEDPGGVLGSKLGLKDSWNQTGVWSGLFSRLSLLICIAFLPIYSLEWPVSKSGLPEIPVAILFNWLATMVSLRLLATL